MIFKLIQDSSELQHCQTDPKKSRQFHKQMFWRCSQCHWIHIILTAWLMFTSCILSCNTYALSRSFEYLLLAIYTSTVKEKRAEYERIHTFRLTLRGTAVVGWQWTQGWSDLLGNNCHPQLPIFSCFFVLVRLCGGRKAKRDFSEFSCMNSHLNWSWQTDRHHCSTPWIDKEHTCLLSTDTLWKSFLTTDLQLAKLWKQGEVQIPQTTAWVFFTY